MTETTPTTTPTPPEGLTDARLLELAAAAIDGYDSIAPGEFEPDAEIAVEAYGSELIAAMRAAIAADRDQRAQTERSVDALTRRADLKLQHARRELEAAQAFARNVRGMKPPTTKTPDTTEPPC